MINKNTKITPICLIALFSSMMLFSYSSAHAQNDRDFATAQDVAIALYKTGNTVPNFQSWIEKTEPYRTTPLAKRPKVMQKEMGKLQKSYQEFSPQKNFLLLRTFVSLNPEEITLDDIDLEPDEILEPKHKMNISFLNAPEALYFPYDFLDQRIAVMPYELNSFMNPDLTKEQFNFIQNRATSRNLMVVRLKCRESDLTLPHKIDGIHQWVLKTDIASMEIWNDKGLLLWEYTAPWYVTPTVLELKDLYEVGRGHN